MGWPWPYTTNRRGRSSQQVLSLSLLSFCRYKTVERLAAEEYERERVRSGPRGLSLTLSPDDSCQSSRSATPTSIASEDIQDIQDTPVTSYPPSESGTSSLVFDSIAQMLFSQEMYTTVRPIQMVPLHCTVTFFTILLQLVLILAEHCATDFCFC